MADNKSGIGIIIVVVAALGLGLSFATGQFASQSAPDAPPAAQAAAPTAATQDPDPSQPTLIVVGDSLSAGYGLASLDQTWVALLQQRLNEQEYGIRVINASISGDTSQGGATRLPAALERHAPIVVVIELGGNDGLRGIALDVMQNNFERMIDASIAAGAKPVLLGMRIPLNYGERYTQAFEQLYVTLSDRYNLPLEPFFLKDVALDPELMQSDGIHPTAEAQPLMLERAWPVIQQAIDAQLPRAARSGTGE
ncbi:MAG: arylesterase [Pseudomonadota bacterium]